jgi:predicted phage terminase large subunit-like protein
VVARDKKVMGPYATAGQFQQEPTPRGGGVIKREWWRLYEASVFPPMEYVVAALDTAYTIKAENDFSALTVWGLFSGAQAQRIDAYATRGGQRRDTQDAMNMFDQAAQVLHKGPEGPRGDQPRLMLMDGWQDRLELHDLVEKVAKTCRRLKVDLLLIENKAAGHSVAQEIRRLYNHEDWGVQMYDPKTLDKLARLYSIQHLFAEGIVYAPDRAFADMVIQQVSVFPKGKNDDIVDTVSMAVKHFRDRGLLIREPEWQAEMQEFMRHQSPVTSSIYEV